MLCAIWLVVIVVIIVCILVIIIIIIIIIITTVVIFEDAKLNLIQKIAPSRPETSAFAAAETHFAAPNVCGFNSPMLVMIGSFEASNLTALTYVQRNWWRSSSVLKVRFLVSVCVMFPRDA